MPSPPAGPRNNFPRCCRKRPRLYPFAYPVQIQARDVHAAHFVKHPAADHIFYLTQHRMALPVQKINPGEAQRGFRLRKPGDHRFGQRAFFLRERMQLHAAAALEIADNPRTGGS